MNKRTTLVTASSMLVALALAGCSSKAADSGGSSSDGELKTDVGVTDDEITLAVQTDTSGVFKVLGLAATHGNELWAEEVNADGGICDREIKLDIQDNGYKADNAIPIYETQKANSLGYVQLIGSPILAALKQKLIADKVTAVTESWASTNLDAPEVMMIGQTYDIEMINGLAWAQQQGMIADGDKIGHIYIDSEYGQNGLLGSQAYAKEHGMEVIGVPVAGTDTDMTATMTKLKDEGVTAIAVTTAPGGMGSIAVQNVAQGMNLPLIGNNPVFSTTLLADATVTAGLANLYMVSSFAPISQDTDEAKKVLDEYKNKFTDPADIGITHGYAAGLAWGEILKQACEDGDMTRQGVLDAKSKVDAVDTKGLTGKLDFSKDGSPTTREGFILQPDASVEDGKLKIVEELFASEEAKAYKAPFEK
ncbi:ABC transporter substrate-binding protein [Blastococcus sp. Marseille-P5729]|uniref:ABC transporter substrate-binding protein n=1 Tax=Blastococcus sp. Marseille-P5729 TaxID=2086582 RepID=UPI00131E8C16|nr:ABC transporter substrate-binding protein [Blastococcus sp. Marseille-P5729]